jgi:hypothetical protein
MLLSSKEYLKVIKCKAAVHPQTGTRPLSHKTGLAADEQITNPKRPGQLSRWFLLSQFSAPFSDSASCVEDKMPVFASIAELLLIHKARLVLIGPKHCVDLFGITKNEQLR